MHKKNKLDSGFYNRGENPSRNAAQNAENEMFRCSQALGSGMKMRFYLRSIPTSYLNYNRPLFFICYKYVHTKGY